MKKILVVPYLEPNDYTYYSSITSQIDKLSLSKDCIIYHFFSDSSIYKKFNVKHINSFFDSSKNIIINISSVTSIKSVIGENLSKCDQMISLCPSLIFKKDVSKIITSNEYEFIASKNNMSGGIRIYNRTKILQLIRNDAGLYDVFLYTYSPREDIPFFLSSDIIDLKEITKYEKPKENIFDSDCCYEDDFCVFCYFSGYQNIVASHSYFNKNNKKIYNIKNNVMGEVIEYEKDFIEVKWNLSDGYSKTIKYFKESNIFKPL